MLLIDAVNKKEIAHLVRREGAAKAAGIICEALKQGVLKAGEFSIRELFEATAVDAQGNAFSLADLRDKRMPDQIGQVCEARSGAPLPAAQAQQYAAQLSSGQIAEGAAAGAVQSDAFAAINNQIFFNAILEGYNMAETNISAEFGVVNSNNLRGERFGGVSNIALPLPVVPEDDEYPSFQPSADFINTPAQRKKGFLVKVTREAILMDRTAELLDKCSKGGMGVAADRELEAVSILMDVAELGPNLAVGTGNNRSRYNWLGTSYGTYQTASPWINSKGSNALVDYTQINAANILLGSMLDPFTGLPINIPAGNLCLVVTPDLELTAHRIKHALQTRTGNQATTGGVVTLNDGDITLPWDFKIIVSKYLKLFQTVNSLPNTTWFWGSLKDAFRWVRALDITESQALPESGYFWSRDIIHAFKAAKIETGAVWNPRYLTESQA